MDVLYPCSLCSQTFKLRKHILNHMKTVHESNVSIICDDDSKSLLNCSQCHKKFNNNSLLNRHIQLDHNISIPNLNKYNSRPSKKRVSQKLNAYLSLEDCLPDDYSYKILAFKDISYGQFKAKFMINNIDKESFLDWLDNLCHKTKINYITESISSISLKNIHRKVYKCNDIDYWDINSNKILQNPSSCKASLSVMIKPLNKELAHQSKVVILMKHCHCHPKNNFTSMKSLDTFYIYDQIAYLLKNGLSAADALHTYTTKIIQNEGTNHYLKLMDSGIKPDVEFVYELYYRHISKSRFASPFIKHVDSLMKSLKYYNHRIGRKSAVVELIKNNIVIAIRTPLMKTINTDTVFVCSTSLDSSKTWFMFGKTDRKIMIPVGVIISTDDKECLLKAGLFLWEMLGGSTSIKTVVVDLVYTHVFQTVFPEATVCVSKFHFLLSVWKWLINVTNNNNLFKELNCFIELKKILCSENFIVDDFVDTNFANVLIEKYPNFTQFMQNINKNNLLFCSTLFTHPCSTISERKFIYYHTKSLSILQTFHFVIDEIDFFYNNLLTDNPNNNRQIILNNFKEINRDKNCFTYCCMNDNLSLYLVENNNDGGKFFVDMDIGLCSCTLNNLCSPCIHQAFLSEHIIINCSVDSDTCVLNTSNYDKEKQNTEKEEFENILSEFQSVHNKIKEQFMIDPEYFKVGIQRFVSTWKDSLTSDKSLLLACNSLSNIYQSNLDNSL